MLVLTSCGQEKVTGQKGDGVRFANCIVKYSPSLLFSQQGMVDRILLIGAFGTGHPQKLSTFNPRARVLTPFLRQWMLGVCLVVGIVLVGIERTDLGTTSQFRLVLDTLLSV